MTAALTLVQGQGWSAAVDGDVVRLELDQKRAAASFEVRSDRMLVTLPARLWHDLVDRAAQASADAALLASGGEVTVDLILRRVEAFYQVQPREFRVQRSKKASLARHVAMYLARKWTSMSFPELGVLFERDQSTVQYACSKVESMRKVSARMRAQLAEIEQPWSMRDVS